MKRKEFIQGCLLSIIMFNIFPILSIISGSQIFLTTIWLLNPLYCMICSYHMTHKYNLRWWCIIMTALMFIPSIFLFYNHAFPIFLIKDFYIPLEQTLYTYILWSIFGILVALLIKRVQGNHQTQ